MELKGHKSQVMCAAISADNKRAVTASKDGTLRVWNINVRYELEEDPKSTLVVSAPFGALSVVLSELLLFQSVLRRSSKSAYVLSVAFLGYPSGCIFRVPDLHGDKTSPTAESIRPKSIQVNSFPIPSEKPQTQLGLGLKGLSCWEVCSPQSSQVKEGQRGFLILTFGAQP
eukprot:1150706-Pelagomonas_calceolata.AAC.3